MYTSGSRISKSTDKQKDYDTWYAIVWPEHCVWCAIGRQKTQLTAIHRGIKQAGLSEQLNDSFSHFPFLMCSFVPAQSKLMPETSQPKLKKRTNDRKKREYGKMRWGLVNVDCWHYLPKQNHLIDNVRWKAERQIERQRSFVCLCVSVNADEGRTENILRTWVLATSHYSNYHKCNDTIALLNFLCEDYDAEFRWKVQ